MTEPASGAASAGESAAAEAAPRGPLPGPDGKPRCPWGLSAPEYVAYHDEEWGRPVRGDRVIFERLSLEAFQSGLSWLTILRKRENFRKAFANFDISAVAAFTDEDESRLLADAGIVRNKAKVRAVIANARAALSLPASLSDLVWSFAPEPAAPAPSTLADLPSATPESKALSKELKKHGFVFTGPVTAYATMQACGIVNDHLAGCFCRDLAGLSWATLTAPEFRARIPRMASDPDITELFAPLVPSQAFSVMLSEAQEVLGHVREPIDAELWGSDMIGALSRPGSDQAAVMAELTGALVPACEEAATPEALALLRIVAAIGSPGLRDAAAKAADRVAALGVAEQPWAANLGLPRVSDCWHYGDIGGRQESVTVSFAYGQKKHALSVLIDHGRGGKIKDAWVGDAEGLLDKTFLAAESDPLVVFERLSAAEAHSRLERAIAAGEAPADPDQRDDLSAHRALLYARMSLLAVESAITPDGDSSPAS